MLSAHTHTHTHTHTHIYIYIHIYIERERLRERERERSERKRGGDREYLYFHGKITLKNSFLGNRGSEFRRANHLALIQILNADNLCLTEEIFSKCFFFCFLNKPKCLPANTYAYKLVRLLNYKTVLFSVG